MNEWEIYAGLGKKINHSCEPNVGIGHDGKNMLYLAFRDI
jgi:hypothetical protein